MQMAGRILLKSDTLGRVRVPRERREQLLREFTGWHGWANTKKLLSRPVAENECAVTTGEFAFDTISASLTRKRGMRKLGKNDLLRRRLQISECQGELRVSAREKVPVGDCLTCLLYLNPFKTHDLPQLFLPHLLEFRRLKSKTFLSRNLRK